MGWSRDADRETRAGSQIGWGVVDGLSRVLVCMLHDARVGGTLVCGCVEGEGTDSIALG